MDIEPYKSLRTIILEVQAVAAKPAAKTPHKVGEPWQTASGNWGAKNVKGQTEYFDSEDNAKAWLAGKAGPAGRVEKPGDTSRKVELDADGYETKPDMKGAAQTNAKTTAVAGAKPTAQPTTGGAGTPQAQAVPANTQRQAQPQGSQKGAEQAQVAADTEQHPEVARENPATEFDSEFKPDPKATAQAKTKRDVRKANIVAAAIKAKKFAGPKTNEDSVFGDPKKERMFIDELNHAALSAMRGEAAYDFELCAKAFADVGFCFDPKTKSGVSKGIPRDRMPQFSSQVDPNQTDSPAFKALMAGKGYTSPDQVTPEDLKAEINMEKEFRKALEDDGYEITEQDAPVTSLKPIQGQLKGEKIAGMYGTLLAAQEDETYAKQAARLLEPIYVSDGYVIDGHHRWAAQCAVDIANGGGANTTMKTRTITKGGKPVPPEDIIAFSNNFQKSVGLLSQTRGGETIPEKKPKTQKEWNMSKFGTKRIQNLVESLNEAAKAKFKKPRIASDEPDTFGYGAVLQRGNNDRKVDKKGNPVASLAQQVNRDARASNEVQKNEKTAQDLLATMNKKPEGTTFEIYGSKNGKETSVKVKKVRYMGNVVYMVGTNEVELRVAGTGLQVIGKKSHRMLLDRGADLIWESADFLDVGRETITEIRKLTKDELKTIRPGMTKPTPKK